VQYDKLYIFEKPLPRQIQLCKIFAKFSKTKFVFKENSKCAISGQKLCNLLPFVHGFRNDKKAGIQ